MTNEFFISQVFKCGISLSKRDRWLNAIKMTREACEMLEVKNDLYSKGVFKVIFLTGIFWVVTYNPIVIGIYDDRL